MGCGSIYQDLQGRWVSSSSLGNPHQSLIKTLRARGRAVAEASLSRWDLFTYCPNHFTSDWLVALSAHRLRAEVTDHPTAYLTNHKQDLKEVRLLHITHLWRIWHASSWWQTSAHYLKTLFLLSPLFGVFQRSCFPLKTHFVLCHQEELEARKLFPSQMAWTVEGFLSHPHGPTHGRGLTEFCGISVCPHLLNWLL